MLKPWQLLVMKKEKRLGLWMRDDCSQDSVPGQDFGEFS